MVGRPNICLIRVPAFLLLLTRLYSGVLQLILAVAVSRLTVTVPCSNRRDSVTAETFFAVSTGSPHPTPLPWYGAVGWSRSPPVMLYEPLLAINQPCAGQNSRGTEGINHRNLLPGNFKLCHIRLGQNPHLCLKAVLFCFLVLKTKNTRTHSNIKYEIKRDLRLP